MAETHVSLIAPSVSAFVFAIISFWLVCLSSIAALSGHFLLDEDVHPIHGTGQFAIVTIFAVAALVGGYVVGLVGREGKVFHSIVFATLVFVNTILTDPYTSKYTFSLAQALLLAALVISGGVLSACFPSRPRKTSL